MLRHFSSSYRNGAAVWNVPQRCMTVLICEELLKRRRSIKKLIITKDES
jgi:hypothetical protein